MIPVIFRIPGLGWEVPGYGLALMIGFLLSVMWAARRAERSGADPEIVLNCGFFALLGGVGGARAMYVYHYWDQFAARGSPLDLIRGILDVRQGGLEVYGGFITAALLIFLYLAVTRRSIRWFLDIMAPSAALGMAIGRIGCFLNGCCFGGVCDLPWAVRFPYGSPAAVQQWSELQPGAGLPQQLLIFPEGGLFSSGLAAMPLPREILTSSPASIEATHRAVQQLAARRAELLGQLARAEEDAQKERLRAEIAKLERQERSQVASLAGLGCSTPPLASVQQMAKHGLSAAELRQLALRYPSLPVHPTQLYSAITLGLLAILLSTLYWRRTRDGQVIGTMLLIEPISRIFLEMVRADNPEDVKLPWLPVPLTISQFLAICLSLLGLLGLLGLRRLPPRSPRAVLWEPPAPPPAGKKKESRAAAR